MTERSEGYEQMRSVCESTKSKALAKYYEERIYE